MAAAGGGIRRLFGQGGPLHDAAAVPGENDGVQNLFAGSIGIYKNAGSHRVVIRSVEEAQEMVALASHLLILLTHLLKLVLAAVHMPHDYARAARGWRVTCRTQRRLIAKRLRRNPSLRPTVAEEVADAYESAREEATAALEIAEDAAPPQCPWTPEQVLDIDFWPA